MITKFFTICIIVFGIAFASYADDMEDAARIDRMFVNDMSSVCFYCDVQYIRNGVVEKTERIYSGIEYKRLRAEFEARREADTAFYAKCPLKPEFTKHNEYVENYVGFVRMRREVI